MTSMIRFLQAERDAEQDASGVVKLVPREPSMAYRLARIVYVADRGYDASPRYAVESYDPDRMVGGIEYEGDDGVEALLVAVDESGDQGRHGVRIEFVGPVELAQVWE
jgi:hypothetical protein